MSHLFSRSILAAVALGLLGAACGSDQKNSNTADSVPPAEAPADTTTPQPGGDVAPAPNGEPTNTPPATPPPQGLNDTRSGSGNSVAMPSAGSSAATTPALSESQIAMVTELANNSEIDQAKLAQSKAKSASVKKFAAMMIKHHTEAKNDQAKLYKQLNLTPTQSPSSTSLKDDADRTLGSLRGASGASFDVAYIDSQVAAHQKVLDSIDHELLPAATDQALIDNLNKMRSTVESHLKEAKSIQAELTKNSAQ